MTILERAKSIERERSTETSITIRLALLQDLIGEIERLMEEATKHGLRLVREKAEERNKP
jgi:hypothetical protein